MTPDLDGELLRAMRFARHAIVAPLFRGVGLSPRVQWGVSRVEFYGSERRLYEPSGWGPAMAFIVPVVEAGELIDLAAIDGLSQHVGQRLGHGHGLGLDAIEKARCGIGDLGLVERPLDWLRDPVGTVYLFALSEATSSFDGVREFSCKGLEFTERVRALFPPSRRASILAVI